MSNIKYDVKSEHAAEFIHDGEIRATLEYGREQYHQAYFCKPHHQYGEDGVTICSGFYLTAEL